MPDIIDINITPVIETVALTIQPNLTTINVNTINGGGGAVDSVNTQTGVVVLNQDDILDGTTYKQYSLTEKNKLAGIAAGAEVNVNADWNAVSGDAQILNKPTIPTAVTQTSQLTNNGADGVNPFITALDIPTTGQASTLVREVKNMTGATLTKGTVVFISGANGNKPLVSKALATTDALSSRTFGLLQSDILNNGLGNCVIIGDLSGLDTSAFAEGAQLYLSGVTAGTYTASKILAPTHLVYVGKVTRSHPTQGQIEVGIQNGYELEEIHDVQIITPLNNQALTYETSTDLWKNKTIIEDSITDGVTTIAPSQNAVFDALALKQDTLVSGTNIKTINGASVLGSGDLVVGGSSSLTVGTTPIASGTIGRVFFQGSGNVLQQSANLFWDNTNSRLGVGATPATTVRLDVRAQGALSTDIAFRVRNSADSANLMSVAGNGNTIINVLATNPILFGRNATFATVPSISMNNTLSDTLMAGFFADDLNFYINSPNRIILRGSGLANNSSFVISNGSMGQGYGSYLTNPSSTNGIYALGKIGVGTNSPLASAKLQVDSTTEGFLPPRMTTTQKNAIASPAAGLVVYDSTLNKLCVYTTAWETITSL